MYYTIADSIKHIGKTVTLKGWVRNQRDMAKILFVDLVDHTGSMQVVAFKTDELPKLGNEYVVEITGEIKARGEKTINPNIPTGHVELKADTIAVLNVSAELPFDLREDTRGINEELRLKHRYLDLRTERMQNNLRLRHKVMRFVRNYLDDAGFTEIDTPILAKGTPEGSREFLVPSRQHPESFYVLPQSPQQFKQLLMVSGLGRYYQLAHIFRDEDQRADRQPEAVQIDLEMSFVDQEQILQLVEKMIVDLVTAVAPHKHLAKGGFPRISYADSMKQYGNDKPDMRKDKSNPEELAFCWVVDFPMYEIGTESKSIEAVHHPFTSPHPDDIELLDKEPLKTRAAAYDLVLNGVELSSGSIRIHDADLQQKAFEVLGMKHDEIESKFGHMLEAFKYGAPPHGGMALGVDRLVMKLSGEDNIREVTAFPKTGDGRDLLMNSPSAANETALAEAHIKTVSPRKKPS